MITKQCKDCTQMQKSLGLQNKCGYYDTIELSGLQNNAVFLTKSNMVIPKCDGICRITGIMKKCGGLRCGKCIK